jgi:hypothetical protein
VQGAGGASGIESDRLEAGLGECVGKEGRWNLGSVRILPKELNGGAGVSIDRNFEDSNALLMPRGIRSGCDQGERVRSDEALR